MASHNDTQRLFIGWECLLSSYSPIIHGRKIDPAHLTLSFLGNISQKMMQQKLCNLPCFNEKISPCLLADGIIFLPENKPRVAALTFSHIPKVISEYQTHLSQWIASLGLSIKQSPFFPHVSLIRQPFDEQEMLRWFVPQPVALQSIHLFESVGNLKYEKRATIPLLAPFEEIEHTADLAFIIRGQTMKELYDHAIMALAYKYPPILSLHAPYTPQDLSDLIKNLNHLITRLDLDVGCPLKAVCYSGDIHAKDAKILEWKMIIDV
jgi:2'-5' RNA ligase